MLKLIGDVEPDFNMSDLIEQGYNMDIVNQIFRAKNKGYDISDVEINADINDLRELVDNMTKEKKFIYLLNLYFVLHEKHAVKQNNTLDSMLKKIDYAIASGINKQIFYYLNNDGTNVDRLIKIANMGLELNEDIYNYLKEGINTGEIEQILIAHNNGFKMEKYIKQMPIIDRDRLQALNKLFQYYNSKSKTLDNTFKKITELSLTLKIMKKVIDCLDANLNIEPIFEKKYNKSQINMLLNAILNNFDLTYLKNENLTPTQMNEIFTGIKQGIDVSLYSNEKFTDEQMQLIRMTLVCNSIHAYKFIDITPILNYNIPIEIMEDYVNAKKDNDLDEILEVLKEISEYEEKTKKIIETKLEK